MFTNKYWSLDSKFIGPLNVITFLKEGHFWKCVRGIKLNNRSFSIIWFHFSRLEVSSDVDDHCWHWSLFQMGHCLFMGILVTVPFMFFRFKFRYLLNKQSFHCLFTSYEEKFKLGYISGKEKRKQSGIVNGNRFEHRLHPPRINLQTTGKSIERRLRCGLSISLTLINSFSLE